MAWRSLKTFTLVLALLSPSAQTATALAALLVRQRCHLVYTPIQNYQNESQSHAFSNWHCLV